MSAPEKPLNVRVAEVLGWTGIKFMGKTWWGFSGPGLHAGEMPVPAFDTEWSATGPLIEQYDLEVGPTYAGLGSRLPSWSATAHSRENRDGEEYARGDTPLVAVCNLIITLHAEGKLD